MTAIRGGCCAAPSRRAKDRVHLYVGPELEYFYLKAHDDPQVLDRAGYFDLIPDDLGTSSASGRSRRSTTWRSRSRSGTTRWRRASTRST